MSVNIVVTQNCETTLPIHFSLFYFRLGQVLRLDFLTNEILEYYVGTYIDARNSIRKSGFS